MKVYWTENLRRRTDREQYEKQGLLEPEAMKKGNQPRIAENALKELGVEE
jgi:hypothetical protein